jgi:lysophospholipase L1-like esterase
VRRRIANHPDRALGVSMFCGVLAAGFFVDAASDQLDLGVVLLRVSFGVFFGCVSLLVLNELMVMELDRAEKVEAQSEPQPQPRSAAAGRIYWLLGAQRWWAFATLSALIGFGLWSPDLPIIGDVASLRVGPQHVGAWAVVAGVAILTGWSLVRFLELERGVLRCPNCWLVGGLLLAFSGAIVWGLADGLPQVGGVIASLFGLVGIKTAFPALLDQTGPTGGGFGNEVASERERRVRAVEATAGGAVTAVGGALLMAVGAAVERAAYLSVGLLVIIGGLSLVGIGGPRLVAPLRDSHDFAASWWRLLTTSMLAIGALAVAWGGTRTVEAAGDWFALVVVICVLVAGFGAWFAYRGEVLVTLGLLIFLVPWVMQERDTIEPGAPLIAPSAAAVEAGGRAAVPGRGVIVAVGDSFMSGEGADDYYRGTNTPGSNQCRRASSAFAVEVAQANDRDLLFLACSGATTTDLRLATPASGEPQMPNSPDGIAGGLRQLDALAAVMAAPDAPDIELVLVSIGGNDTGFSPIVQACLLPTDCSENEDLWVAKAESLETTLIETYEEIRSVAGDIPIVVVPYPEFISPRACDRLAGQGEFEFVVRFIDALNHTIHRAAKRAGVLVANTSHTFEGWTQCDAEPAANLVVLSPPSGRNVLGRLGPGNWVHNSMHPHTKGHRLQAQALGPVVAELLAGCSGEVSCRAECVLPNAPVVDRLLQPGPVGLVSDAPRPSPLVDTCNPAPAVTPPDDVAVRVAAADQLLETMVVTELYRAAGLLLAPFVALLAGGLLIAIGLSGRPGPVGHGARFLSPLVPKVDPPGPEAEQPDQHPSPTEAGPEPADNPIAVSEGNGPAGGATQSGGGTA